jgi:DNA-binding beta-propeller fold protein YncE
MKTLLAALLAVVVVGCSDRASSPTTTPATNAPPATSPPAPAGTAGPATATAHRAALGAPVAVVTAETEHAVLEVSAATGRVLRRVPVTGDPTTLAAASTGPVVVCSPAAGTVTLLAWPGLRPVAVLHRFHTPEIAAITPDGEWALVSDAAGTVSTIELSTHRIVDRVWVGRGAHHMAVNPDQRVAWVALGETASTIVRLDITDPKHLRVAGRLHPRTTSHDLAFSPNGRTVWVTSSNAPYVTIYNAATGRPVATVPAGTAPQHVAFSHTTTPARAYIASGYGRSLEMVAIGSGRILHRAALPYGSFNLSTIGSMVATTSLLDGEVTVLNAADLRPRLSATVAPEAREIVLLRKPGASG